MHLYLAPYVGAGTVMDPFRPRGSEQPGWSAIDLRYDCTVPEGFAFFAVRERDAQAGLYLGDAPDEPSYAVRRLLGNRLGLTLTTRSPRRQIVETFWPRLRPTAHFYDLWLGGLFWRQPIIAGGTTITDSFTTADSGTLGGDLTWAEVEGDWAIVSNQAQVAATGAVCSARAESDLATDNHYAQVTVADLGTPNSGEAMVGGAAARFAAAAATYYTGHLYQFPTGSDSARTQKCVATVLTTIGSETNITWAATDTVKIECSGTSITRYYNGGAQDTTTDAAISGNTRCGIFGFDQSVGVVTLDNFEAADVATGWGRLVALQNNRLVRA